MPEPRRLSEALFASAVLLFGLALLAITIPALNYGHAASKTGFRLTADQMQVVLPARQQYGIYVEDTDNSGYAESCTITDADGQQVRLHDPWWTVSRSANRTLDIVFNTGSGKLSIACSISAERVTIRPVPNLKAVLAGIAISGLLGCAGTALMIARHRTRRSHLSPPTYGSQNHNGFPSATTNPQ
ncbi:hypothetical protein ACSMXN_07635 [Jatrophihabitans sp. DSM 45814]